MRPKLILMVRLISASSKVLAGWQSLLDSEMNCGGFYEVGLTLDSDDRFANVHMTAVTNFLTGQEVVTATHYTKDNDKIRYATTATSFAFFALLLQGCGNQTAAGGSSVSAGAGTSNLSSSSISSSDASVASGSQYCTGGFSNLLQPGEPIVVPATISCSGQKMNFIGIKFLKDVGAYYSDTTCSTVVTDEGGLETNFVGSAAGATVPNGRSTDVSTTDCQPLIDPILGHQLVFSGHSIFIRYHTKGWDQSTGAIYSP